MAIPVSAAVEPDRPFRERGWVRQKRFLIAGALVLLAALFFLPPQLAPRHFPADDSYFYAQVARNIAAGKGSTFNGVTPTNGYHPLWMVFSVIGAALTGGILATMRLIMGIEMVLTVGIIGLFVLLCRDLKVRLWPLGVPVLAVFFGTGLYLSEAHVNGLTVLASILVLERAVARRAPARTWLLVGVVLGFAVLARLDNIFFVLAAGLAVMTVAGSPRLRLVRGSLTAAGAAVVTLPYLTYNHLRYGHLEPISGAIKSTFPHTNIDVHNLGSLGILCALVAVVSVVFAVMVNEDRTRRCAMLVLGFGVLGQAAYIVLFTDHGTTNSWYQVLGVVNIALFLAVGADHISHALPARFGDRLVVRTVAGASLVLLILGSLRGWARYANANAADRPGFSLHVGTTNDRWPTELGDWMRTHLPPGTRVVVSDNPGQIAYYSGLSILNIDGLMSDYQYEKDILRLGPTTYFADHNFTYYVGPQEPHAGPIQSVVIDAPFYRKPAGRLSLDDSRIVVKVRDVAKDPSAPDWAVWRL